jgi:O-antigen ligase
LGYGTGATKKHVLRFYEKEGLSKAIKYKYNAHNQFIQFFIANGLLGVFCFLLCIVLPLKLALSSKDWIFVSFIFVFFFTSLVESTLLRQKGIVFFALFNSLLIANFSKRTFFSNKSQSKVLNI